MARRGSNGDRPNISSLWRSIRRSSAGAATRVNTLRLWSAQPVDPIYLDKFNSGDHIGALEESSRAEAISRVLYPADSTPSGQELRLRQEYFFSSASLQDIVRRHMQQYGDMGSLPDKVAIQLNDTHPAISIAEMMRILIDLHGHQMGAGVEADQGYVRLHQPHAAARGARDLAGVAARADAAAADADHLRDQCRGADRSAQGRGLQRSADRRGLADRRGRGAPRAHGAVGLRRLALGQWRVGAAHRADEEDGLFGPQQALSRTHQQQDQWRHAAALADGMQSGADQADHASGSGRSSRTISIC